MDPYVVYDDTTSPYEYVDYDTFAYPDAEPYITDTGWYDPEYDEYYTEPSDIPITDEIWEEDPYALDIDDTWIPLPPPSTPTSTLPSANQQQIYIGQSAPFFPGAVELSQGYCQLYPDECLNRGGTLRVPGVNTTCTAESNCTRDGMALENGRGMSGFRDVDLSGMGLGVLVALLLLMGLHMGWDGAGKKGSDKGEPSSRSPGEGKNLTPDQVKADAALAKEEKKLAEAKQKQRDGKPGADAGVKSAQKAVDEARKNKKKADDAAKNAAVVAEVTGGPLATTEGKRNGGGNQPAPLPAPPPGDDTRTSDQIAADARYEKAKKALSAADKRKKARKPGAEAEYDAAKKEYDEAKANKQKVDKAAKGSAGGGDPPAPDRPRREKNPGGSGEVVVDPNTRSTSDRRQKGTNPPVQPAVNDKRTSDQKKADENFDKAEQKYRDTQQLQKEGKATSEDVKRAKDARDKAKRDQERASAAAAGTAPPPARSTSQPPVQPAGKEKRNSDQIKADKKYDDAEKNYREMQKKQNEGKATAEEVAKAKEARDKARKQQERVNAAAAGTTPPVGNDPGRTTREERPSRPPASSTENPQGTTKPKNGKNPSGGPASNAPGTNRPAPNATPPDPGKTLAQQEAANKLNTAQERLVRAQQRKKDGKPGADDDVKKAEDEVKRWTRKLKEADDAAKASPAGRVGVPSDGQNGKDSKGGKQQSGRSGNPSGPPVVPTPSGESPASNAVPPPPTANKTSMQIAADKAVEEAKKELRSAQKDEAAGKAGAKERVQAAREKLSNAKKAQDDAYRVSTGTTKTPEQVAADEAEKDAQAKYRVAKQDVADGKEGAAERLKVAKDNLAKATQARKDAYKTPEQRAAEKDLRDKVQKEKDAKRAQAQGVPGADADASQAERDRKAAERRLAAANAAAPTSGQRGAAEDVEKKRKVLTDAVAKEEEEKRKAKLEATRLNGGKTPDVIPDTPGLIAAKKERTNAEEDLKKALDKKDKADAAAKSPQSEKGDSSSMTPMILLGALLLIPIAATLFRGGLNLSPVARGIVPPVSGGVGGGGYVAPTRKWVTAPKPAGPSIMINNVAAAGEDIPINVEMNGGGGPILEEIIIETRPEPIYVAPPIATRISYGTAQDPDLFLLMLLSLLIAGAPLAYDWFQDWSGRKYVKPDYAKPLYHWLGLGVLAFMCLAIVERHYHITAYSEPVVGSIRGRITPTILTAAGGIEDVVIGTESLFGGSGANVLGVFMTGIAGVLLTQREPDDQAEKTEYSPIILQCLYIGGTGLVGLLLAGL